MAWPHRRQRFMIERLMMDRPMTLTRFLLIGVWMFLACAPARAAEDLPAGLAPYFQAPPQYQGGTGSGRSPLLFHNGERVRSAEDWSKRRSEILAEWHEIMGPWPALLESPTLEILETATRENLVQHRVRVPMAAGLAGLGYLMIPPGRGPFPAVLVPYYEPETSIGLGQPLRDFGYQLAKRGFVTLSIGSPGGDARDPAVAEARCQPLSFLAYVAANCATALASRPEVDRARLGVVGHSYGGKWAMFAACLDDRFACGAWSDPGIQFDETRANVNYWERWYLGAETGRERPPGIPSPDNPRTGAYRRLIERGRDLHELQALMAPRPFLVSGGAEDPLERWRVLSHVVAVNDILAVTNRVAMTTRASHDPTEASNDALYLFFEHFLKPPPIEPSPD